MGLVSRLERGYRNAQEEVPAFRKVAQAIINEVSSPIKTAEENLAVYAKDVDALILAGTDGVNTWHEGLGNIQHELVRRLPAVKPLIDSYLDAVIDTYNSRHLMTGMAYTATEVANYSKIKLLGIDEARVARYIVENRKDITSVKNTDGVHYGLRTKRNLEFVMKRLETLRAQGLDKIKPKDIDPINASSVGLMVSRNQTKVGLRKEKYGNNPRYLWRSPQVKQREEIGPNARIRQYIYDEHPKRRLFLPSEIKREIGVRSYAIYHFFERKGGFRKTTRDGRVAYVRLS